MNHPDTPSAATAMTPRRFSRWGTRLAAAALAALALPAQALDLQWSGFGTLGYAQSNRPYAWQRSITDDGSFERDTVLGAQADLRLSAEWSATVQARLAHDEKRDGVWTPTIALAFLAWRPHNDWLLRAGKFRVPLFLFSEVQDVGTAYDMLRLPNDTYTLNPTSDVTGAYGTRTWQFGLRELSADFYSGSADTRYRRWLQDGALPVLAPGATFIDVRPRATGLILTLRDPTFTARLGAHRVAVQLANGRRLATTYPRVDLGNGLGYWQISNDLPGPGVTEVDRVHNLVYTAGVDWSPDGRWRVVAELARFEQDGTDFGIEAKSGYLTLSRRIGDFTPYVAVSRVLSAGYQREWAHRLRSSDLPPVIPGAALINGLQRAAADTLLAYDQSSLALGASLALAPNVKLKAEWMRTRIGGVTASASLWPGMAYPSEGRIDVTSVSLSFDF